MKKIFGLLGQNISYSLSPCIHNHAAKILGLDASYVLFDLSKNEDLKSVLDDLWSKGISGLNVTQPFKSQLDPFLEHTSRFSLSSYNTLFRGKNFWQGASTDGPGFVRAIEDHLKEPINSFQRIIFLGSGGVVLGLLEHFKTLTDFAFYKKIFYIIKRSSKNEHYLKTLGISENAFLPFNPDALSKALYPKEIKTLLIQASSAPLFGNNLAEFKSCLKDLKGVFYDMIYKAPSCLLEEAQKKGITSSDGLSMLIEQARLSQEIWWGKTVSYDEIKKVITSSSSFR